MEMRKLLALFIISAMVMPFLSSCANAPETMTILSETPPPAEPASPDETPSSTPTPTPTPSPAPTSKPDPTPEPTPTPSPTSEPEITPEPSPTSDSAAVSQPTAPPTPKIARNDAYFDNAVFIGDSVMEGLRQYVVKQRKTETTLGEAKFLATIMGISIADLVGDRQIGKYYSYKGAEKPLEDIIIEMGVSRIFLMMGLNDLGGVKDPVIEDIADQYSRLIDLLQETVPGVDIIIMTNTPKTKTSWLPSYTANRKFGNPLIDSFVGAVIGMCDSKNIPYIDVNKSLKDDSGTLPNDYSRDDYVHINDKGARVVVNALYAFAEDRKN